MVSYKALNTVRERTFFDAGHAVGDGHRGQGAAATKRPFAYAGHAVGDGHRF